MSNTNAILLERHDSFITHGITWEERGVNVGGRYADGLGHAERRLRLIARQEERAPAIYIYGAIEWFRLE